MNQILLESNHFRECTLKFGFKAIEENNFSLLVELSPNESYHENPLNDWDEWENQKYMKNIGDCINNWLIILRIARRIKKLEEKRLLNPNYCNKSEYNLVQNLENKSNRKYF